MTNYRLFLAIAILTCWVNHVFGQQNILDIEVHLDSKGKTIEQVLNQIENQIQIRFAFDKKIIPLNEKLTQHIEKARVGEVLKLIFNKNDIHYKVIGNQVSLYKTSKTERRNYTVSGYVKDAQTGEALIGATVFLPETRKGLSTNEYGFFSITLSGSIQKIRFSFIGYRTEILTIDLSLDQSMQVLLEPTIELQGVEIIDSVTDASVESTQTSMHYIPLKKIEKLPVLLGERDLMRTIQLLPGIQSGCEGGTGLYVRGGSPDQNLILLDGVPLYNVNHLLGFFSVFNGDAINSARITKGGFSARHGGRLSSVLDVRMKEGNMHELHGSGSIGLISSRINLEGPIEKGKSSFIFSARRTYLDVIAKPFMALASTISESSSTTGGYFFHDLNLKMNHKFSDKSRLYFSSYYGDDKFTMNQTYTNNYSSFYENVEEQIMKGKIRWGNLLSVLRWNYQINPSLFSNTTVSFSKYRFNTQGKNEDIRKLAGQTSSSKFVSEFDSGIYDFSVKSDFDYLPHPDHYIKFGFGNIYHTFVPGGFQGEVTEDEDSFAFNMQEQKLNSFEYHAYVEDDFKLGALWKVNAGLHFSGFAYSEKAFHHLQPRLAARYLITDKSSIKASYSRMVQYMHLLTNPTTGMPMDLWVPATKNAPPEFSDQISLGYNQQLSSAFHFRTELFYKTMNNIIEYQDGSSYFGYAVNWEKKIEIGKGKSYGCELFLEKTTGKTSGWIGYTLSWSKRQFENINMGKEFPYRYDRRHDLSVVITHKFNDRIDAGLTWVYGTGEAITLGFEKYAPMYLLHYPVTWNDYQKVIHIDGRNNFRMPAYHRLDLGVNFSKQKRWGKRTWSFGLYNAYSRQNPFFLFVKHNGNGTTQLQQLSVFPVIPSFSYSFKF